MDLVRNSPTDALMSFRRRIAAWMLDCVSITRMCCIVLVITISLHRLHIFVVNSSLDLICNRKRNAITLPTPQHIVTNYSIASASGAIAHFRTSIKFKFLFIYLDAVNHFDVFAQFTILVLRAVDGVMVKYRHAQTANIIQTCLCHFNHNFSVSTGHSKRCYRFKISRSTDDFFAKI